MSLRPENCNEEYVIKNKLNGYRLRDVDVADYISSLNLVNKSVWKDLSLSEGLICDCGSEFLPDNHVCLASRVIKSHRSYEDALAFVEGMRKEIRRKIFESEGVTIEEIYTYMLVMKEFVWFDDNNYYAFRRVVTLFDLPTIMLGVDLPLPECKCEGVAGDHECLAILTAIAADHNPILGKSLARSAVNRIFLRAFLCGEDASREDSRILENLEKHQTLNESFTHGDH